MTKLKRYHTGRFRKIMRRHFGVRVDFMGDEAIGPLLEQGIRENVDLIKTIPPRYHAALKRDMLRLAADAPFDQQAVAKVLPLLCRCVGLTLSSSLVRQMYSVMPS